MASIRIASIQKKPAGFFFFWNDFRTRIDSRITVDHSNFACSKMVSPFSVCLIWKISQIFGNLRHLQTTTTHSLTSFHGVGCQPRLQGCHLKKKNHLTPPKWSTEKNELQNHHPPKKLSPKTICFLVKTSKKKKQLVSTNQMLEFTGQTWIAQPLLKKLTEIGPGSEQVGFCYQPPSASDGGKCGNLSKGSHYAKMPREMGNFVDDILGMAPSQWEWPPRLFHF